MADAGENRPITRQVNAKDAETVRESKQMVSEERSTEKASDARFGGAKNQSRRRAKTGGPKPPDPKAR